MPLANLFVGSLYIQNYNGTAWSQPGGPGTTVYPQQQIGTNYAAYPVVGQIWAENSGLWVAGCGHWFDCVRVFHDYDNMLESSAAVICCPLCSFLIRLIEPYDQIYNVNDNMIIIP